MCNIILLWYLVESSPRYQAWLREHDEAEEALRIEEVQASLRRNAQWLEDELRAQQDFKLRQLEKEKQNAEIARQKVCLHGPLKFKKPAIYDRLKNFKSNNNKL